MNLCFKYPIIYWNCACLQINSGGIGSGTDYDKLAAAMGKMIKAGIQISLPNINTSQLEFKPDAKNNTILYGLKGITNIGDNIIFKIIENRPYISPKDFIQKINPTKTVMINLIKSGAFDDMIERKILMGWYIWEICDRKKELNLRNLQMLLQNNLLPNTEEFKQQSKIFYFNKFLKANYKINNKYNDCYCLNEKAINFLIENNFENLIYQRQEEFLLNIKEWDKIYQQKMDLFRKYIKENQQELLKEVNNKAFLEEWKKYAQGNYSKWELDSVCFYFHEHELANINFDKYGLSKFDQLPEEPEINNTFYRGGKLIKMYKLSKICGTCIAKKKDKGLVTLLTPQGVVVIKFPKEYFSIFDKQVSAIQPDGSKKIVERSWFNRGNMIIVQGYRNGDNFIPKKYASSGGHQLYKIDKIDELGNIILRVERAQGEIKEDDL